MADYPARTLGGLATLRGMTAAAGLTAPRRFVRDAELCGTSR